MKFQALLAAVMTLTLGVNAMSSNTGGMPGQRQSSLLHSLQRHLDPAQGHDVGPMLKSAENMLMDLATSQKGAPLADIVAEIRPFISQMQDSINDAHSSAQQTLDSFDRDISGCNGAKSQGEGEASSLSSTRKSSSDDHKSCRTRQKIAEDEHAGCQSTLTALQRAKDNSCQAYEDAKKTPGCGAIPNFGDTWESYISQLATWSVQERDTFMQKQAACNKDTSDLEAQRTLCLGADGSGGKKKTFEDTKQKCDEKQAALEAATCSYASKVKDTCESFSTCSNTLALSYEAQKSSIEALEHQRQVEWAATERLLCLLDVYGESGDANATKLETCQHIVVDINHLLLRYPTPHPQPAACGDYLPHPCGTDYTRTEYGNLDAAAGECTPCVFANSRYGDGGNQAKFLLMKLKAGSDRFQYDASYWTDNSVWNEAEGGAYDNSDDADVKTADFNTRALTQIEVCYKTLDNCFEYDLGQEYTSARAVFSSGWIHSANLGQGDATSDEAKTAWTDLFLQPGDELYNTFWNGGSGTGCQMQRPGINTVCKDNNRARIGYCTNVPSQACQPSDSNDADSPVGIGLKSQNYPKNMNAPFGEYLFHRGKNEDVTSRQAQAWLFGKGKPPVIVAPSAQANTCTAADVRLMVGGRPEIFWDGDWYPICGHYFWDNNIGADRFCSKLGGSSGKVTAVRGKYEKDAMPLGACQSGQPLTDCLHAGVVSFGDLNIQDGWCNAGKDISISIECEGAPPPASSCSAEAWVGCYVDDGDRMFNRGPHQYGYNGNTCASQCSQIGTTHFSLQNGGWCACGTQDDFDKKSVYTQTPEAQCGQIEDRFAGYRGGGGWRNAVYKISQAPVLHVNQETIEVPVGFGYFTGPWTGHCNSAFTSPNWHDNLGSIPADCNVEYMAKAPDGNFIAAMTGQAWFKMVKVDSKTGETVPNSGRYGADYSQPEKLDATSISEFYDEAEDAGAGYLFMRNSQFQQAQCGSSDIMDPQMATGVVEPLAIGVKSWEDRTYQVGGSIPPEMQGALFYRMQNHKTLKKNKLEFSNMQVGSTLFVCSEAGRRHCGYPSSLISDGFTKLSPSTLNWNIDFNREDCYMREVTQAAFSLPTITGGECVQFVMVKC